MGATIRTPVSTGSATTGNVTVNRPTGTTNGDLLVAIQAIDPDGAATAMTAPAGWTQTGSTQSLNNAGRGKAWYKVAASEPASWVFNGSGSATNSITVLAVTGYNVSTPFDVTATWGGSATATTSQAAPSISPTVPDTVLVCAVSGLAQSGGQSYTSPGSMTELADFTSGSWLQMVVAHETLASSGATGTRTFTFTVSKAYISVSLAIAPAAAAAATSRPPAVSPWRRRLPLLVR